MQALIDRILNSGEKLIIIDGMSAAGKTTLANALSEKIGYGVIHIDDFFLPKDRQTDEIAGNIDAERFNEQIMKNLGGEIYYQKYSCKSGTYSDFIKLSGERLIIEGAYSLHKSLNLPRGLKVFMEISKEEQKRRILLREENPDRFFKLWILKEEEYFKKCKVKQSCDIIL